MDATTFKDTANKVEWTSLGKGTYNLACKATFFNQSWVKKSPFPDELISIINCNDDIIIFQCENLICKFDANKEQCTLFYEETETPYALQCSIDEQYYIKFPDKLFYLVINQRETETKFDFNLITNDQVILNTINKDICSIQDHTWISFNIEGAIQQQFEFNEDELNFGNNQVDSVDFSCAAKRLTVSEIKKINEITKNEPIKLIPDPINAPDRAARIFKELNDDIFCLAAESEWYLPFMEEGTYLDADIRECLKDYYIKTGRIIADICGSKNVAVYDSKLVCHDVDLAVKSTSPVSEMILNTIISQPEFKTYIDSYTNTQNSYSKPLTASYILALLHLEILLINNDIESNKTIRKNLLQIYNIELGDKQTITTDQWSLLCNITPCILTLIQEEKFALTEDEHPYLSYINYLIKNNHDEKIDAFSQLIISFKTETSKELSETISNYKKEENNSVFVMRC